MLLEGGEKMFGRLVVEHEGDFFHRMRSIYQELFSFSELQLLNIFGGGGRMIFLHISSKSSFSSITCLSLNLAISSLHKSTRIIIKDKIL